MTWAHHFRPSTGRPAPGWEIWRECERNKTAAKSMIRRLAQRGKRAWQNSNPVYLYSNLKKTMLCSPCERRGQALGFCAGRNARECGGLQQPRLICAVVGWLTGHLLSGWRKLPASAARNLQVSCACCFDPLSCLLQRHVRDHS
jgi:hypothetical protein